MAISFRPNVGAIIQRSDARILIGERNDIANAWQFPQGGIHPGETPEQALRRELIEEIGLQPEHYRVGQSRGGYQYRFPGDKTKEGYHGQEQIYFLVHLLGPDTSISVDTDAPEFVRVRWIHPREFDLAWVLPTKRAVYQNVLRDFFQVEPTETHFTD